MVTSPVLQQRLTNALALAAEWPVPAVSAAVVGADQTLVTFGDLDAVFDLASVTKLLTAYAALVAIEEGTLGLEDPVATNGATVRHLLAHAGGFAFDSGIYLEPEVKRTYSNTGFEALGQYLQEQADMPIDEYISAAVLQPLGMTSTSMGRSVAYSARSTVADLIRFAHELLIPTLVHAATMADATRVQYPGLDGILPGYGSQRPNDWGLGFELRSKKSPHWTGRSNSPATFGHFGAAGTFLWVDPSLATALVVLTNEPFGPWAQQAWPPLSDAVIEALAN